MSRFLIFFGPPVLAIIIFFSGSLPYTLIDDEATLREAGHPGDEPVSVETSFRSRTWYIRQGSYRCEMRWAIGRLTG